jgi:hypothetical protein
MKLRFSIRDILWATLTSALVLVHILDCKSSIAAEAQVDSSERQANEVLDLLRGLPRWPLLPAISDKERDAEAALEVERLEKAAEAIAKYETKVIRDAFVRYSTKNNDLEALYLLNKYLFNLPATARRDSKHLRYLAAGGWHGLPRTGVKGSPQPDDIFSVLWPWTVNANGRLHFMLERRPLIFTGSQYKAVETFDYYSKHFGRRDVKQKLRDVRNRQLLEEIESQKR